MSSYTTLVNVDVDTAGKLTQYIAQLIGGTEGSEFSTACKTLITEAKTEALITKFLEKKNVIMKVENEKGRYGSFVVFDITKFHY